MNRDWSVSSGTVACHCLPGYYGRLCQLINCGGHGNPYRHRTDPNSVSTICVCDPWHSGQFCHNLNLPLIFAVIFVILWFLGAMMYCIYLYRKDQTTSASSLPEEGGFHHRDGERTIPVRTHDRRRYEEEIPSSRSGPPSYATTVKQQQAGKADGGGKIMGFATGKTRLIQKEKSTKRRATRSLGSEPTLMKTLDLATGQVGPKRSSPLVLSIDREVVKESKSPQEKGTASQQIQQTAPESESPLADSQTGQSEGTEQPGKDVMQRAKEGEGKSSKIDEEPDEQPTQVERGTSQ